MSLPPLVSVSDPDWKAFNEQDPEYFLRSACDQIRAYCGWHIYPNIEQTEDKLKIRSKGKIMLPSLHVTAVDSLEIQVTADEWSLLDEGEDFEWFEYGEVQPVNRSWWGQYGYYYGNDPYYLPVYQFGVARATFHSGFDECPLEVKEIAFEMATAGTSGLAQLPANVGDISSPGFKLGLGGGGGGSSRPLTGMTLSTDQAYRLADYKLTWTA